MKTAGIDGCRAGWLAVSLDKSLASWQLLRTVQELSVYAASKNGVFIDIPIGLSETEPVRTCDALLRRVLGKGYASSVFSPPVRAAFMVNDYVAACDINEAKTGKRITKQAWNIMPKIRQVDELLAENPGLVQVLHESHPELLFKKLNRGGEPLQKKKTPEGLEQRRQLLFRADSRIEGLYETMRGSLKKSEAKDDDLLDALVLAVMVAQSPYRPVRTLPLPPETDSRGIPMAIHFV
ncbi:putative nuclease (RNAse H fold) [Cyclonatronum proteinivorum]|uniref:Putative nuclease (RNAse H fold) n=1 Tax=Cyclonatronum proteinivorum TaxID=1457365 RepID=A0A345UPY5_9BACT|nr:DUF429 domain-containing protein [Cyclonatronum proteinivorum]AXJ02537.1 putative nuclease (RNAse H fold) [Cyclonatronum proteinivorum]